MPEAEHTLTEGQKDLARTLYDVGAVKLRQEGEEGFKLKIHQTQPDAPLSPIFLNLRTPEVTTHGEGTLDAETMTEIGEEMIDLIERRRLQFDHIAGIPNAGKPFAAALIRAGEARGRVFSELALHKEGDLKTRRITGQVTGEYDAGESVLLIDDLVTHAATKLEAIKALRDQGLKVSDLLVLVDREQGGAEHLNGEGVTTHAVFSLSEMLELYRSEDTISEDIYREIKDYLAG